MIPILKYTIGFIQRGKEFLLLNRNKPPMMGFWHGIGGKLEPNEHPVDGIIREAFEEVGIRITRDDVDFRGIVSWYDDQGEQDGMYLFRIVLDEFFVYPTPFEMDEGIVAWKPLEWISSEHNYGIGEHIKRLLPVMLFESDCYEHRCTFEGSRLLDYELMPLDKYTFGGENRN